MTVVRGPVALTIGDPNGIGPEIAVKAAVARRDAPPIVIGDADVVRTSVQRWGDGLPVHDVRRAGAEDDVHAGAINLLAVEGFPGDAFRPGETRAEAGAATVAYVEAALALVRDGRAGAIVACPHSEAAVNAAGIAFSGYPSLLARLMNVPADRVFLMLAGGGLRIVHATLHERLRDALDRLTPDLIEAAALSAVDALARFGVTAPRIGVMAINPHAGEGGLFGDDDDRITAPAVQRLRARGVAVDGPAGADALLARRGCEAYVAMYHDQGHVPVKLLAPRDTAALSIGGGVLFSSVGHGSAFDIAGRGVADPSAVLRAIDLLAPAGASFGSPHATPHRTMQRSNAS